MISNEMGHTRDNRRDDRDLAESAYRGTQMPRPMQARSQRYNMDDDINYGSYQHHPARPSEAMDSRHGHAEDDNRGQDQDRRQGGHPGDGNDVRDLR
jgi:hypothetical protein